MVGAGEWAGAGEWQVLENSFSCSTSILFGLTQGKGRFYQARTVYQIWPKWDDGAWPSRGGRAEEDEERVLKALALDRVLQEQKRASLTKN